MSAFPEAFVKKIALQKFIDSKRPFDHNSIRDWRIDVNEWNGLSESHKQPWYETSEQWLSTWSEKHPDSVKYIVENWIDIDFSITPI